MYSVYLQVFESICRVYLKQNEVKERKDREERERQKEEINRSEKEGEGSEGNKVIFENEMYSMHMEVTPIILRLNKKQKENLGKKRNQTRNSYKRNE